MSIKGRIAEAVLGVPVFIKVMGIALGLVVLLGFGLLWQIHQTWHRTLLVELEQRGSILARDVAAHCDGLPGEGGLARLRPMLAEITATVPDVEYVLIVDARGELLLGAPAEGLPPEVLSANHPMVGGNPQIALLKLRDCVVHDVAVPVAGRGAGTVRVGMCDRRVRYEIGWLTRRLARTTAVIGAIGMALAWLLTGVLTHPLRDLIRAAGAVREGNLQARAPHWAADEFGELATAFNAMADGLEQKEAIRQKLLRQVIAAGEDERKRLARELHDQTGQTLTALVAGLGVLEAGATEPAQRQRLAELRELAAQTVSEVHEVALALRPSVLDDLGLLAALQKHCQTMGQRFGLEVVCEAVGLDGDHRLPAELEVALYRIVQETLTNAVRHSRARHVHVLLQRKDSNVLTVVEDDGQGFDPAAETATGSVTGGLGLLGVEERVTLLGGRLQVESQPGEGTRVFVQIPLPPR